MTQEDLFQLFAKYLRGEASEKEAETFVQLMDSEEASILIQAYIKAYQISSNGLPVDQALTDRIYQRIQAKMPASEPAGTTSEPPEMPLHQRRYLPTLRPAKAFWKAAAIIIIILLSATVAVYLLPDYTGTSEAGKTADNFSREGIPAFPTYIKAVDHTENMELADHSSIVIKAGSRLGIAKDFNRTKRSVFLDGEAYFDVAHNTKKPFLIHTEALVVEVLGTAFNVNSYSGQDSVSIYVTRGKVLVRDKSGTIQQILTANQSITYHKNLKTYIVRTQGAEQQRTLAWAAEDMVFDKVTMRQVLSTLSHRYNITVLSKDSALMDTKVKISFTGTEPLKNVMDALSVITGSTYSLSKDTLKVLQIPPVNKEP